MSKIKDFKVYFTVKSNMVQWPGRGAPTSSELGDIRVYSGPEKKPNLAVI